MSQPPPMYCPLPIPSPWALDDRNDPPVYSRPMVGSERSLARIWKSLDGKGDVCLGVNFTSSLSIEQMKDRARLALDKLRFVCPIIACTVEDFTSPRWIYTPSADRDAWLNLAFVVEDQGSLLKPREFVQETNLKRLPYNDGNGMSTFFRAYLLTTSEQGNEDKKEYGLYFHGPHFIIDGRPALRALNLMFEWISGSGIEVTIILSEEWKNLPVDPITATGGPSQKCEMAGSTFLQDFVKASTMPSRAMPPPSGAFIPSNLLFDYTIILPEATTAAIVAQMKEIGVSVSALFQAAHALAQFKMNPVPSKAEVDFPTSATNVSLERYMKAPVEPKTHLVSSLTWLPLCFSMTETLMEPTEKRRLIATARTLQKHLKDGLANPCLPHFLAAVETMAQNKASTPQASLNPWSCVLTDLGVVENRLNTEHKEISAKSIHFGVRVATAMTVHTWTMNSKFHFKVQGADAWGEECMKSLLKETVRIVLLVIDEPMEGSEVRPKL